MRRKWMRLTLAMVCMPPLLAVGCLSGNDVRAVAEGQFVAFVNTLINSVTSDAIRAAIGA